jgi:hypothetical protein
MNMLEGGSVANHLNEFNTVTNQLCSIKVDFDDEVRSLLIMCSFPEIWNGLVMVVSNSISVSNTLKFDDVVVIARKCDGIIGDTLLEGDADTSQKEFVSRS